MSRKQKLRRQKVLSVRITNEVDDGFLAWLNQAHEQGILSRLALEGLYMQYSQSLDIPGFWVPVTTKESMSIPKEVLTNMLSALPHATEKIQQEEGAYPEQSTVVHTSVEGPENASPEAEEKSSPQPNVEIEAEESAHETSELDRILFGSVNDFLNNY